MDRPLSHFNGNLRELQLFNLHKRIILLAIVLRRHTKSFSRTDGIIQQDSQGIWKAGINCFHLASTSASSARGYMSLLHFHWIAFYYTTIDSLHFVFFVSSTNIKFMANLKAGIRLSWFGSFDALSVLMLRSHLFRIYFRDRLPTAEFQSERPRDWLESCFECFIYVEKSSAWHGASSYRLSPRLPFT